MGDPRSGWMRLGVGFVGEPSRGEVDLEELLLETARESPRDPRLFWGGASWLACYGELVDGRRLTARLEGGQGPAELAALVVASGASSLKGVLRKCGRRQPGSPLFEVEAENPVLRAKVKSGALEEFLQWGLWVDEKSLSLDAVRPSRWVLRENRNLLVRAVLGPGLRAELLNVLMEEGRGMTAAELQRLEGRQYASVHGALSSLWLGNLVTREVAGRRVVYRVPGEVRDWLWSHPGLKKAKRVA